MKWVISQQKQKNKLFKIWKQIKRSKNKHNLTILEAIYIALFIKCKRKTAN